MDRFRWDFPVRWFIRVTQFGWIRRGGPAAKDWIMKRIIPISSGKGGVGKTSFAINLSLCLARHGRTVLVDLDTGTSSIRTVIEASIDKDLYHFFKKGEPLKHCIMPLPKAMDPAGAYGNFGFIAAPRHMIHSIANMDASFRHHLIDALNGLDADYVVLDLRAGLDPMVTEFLPMSNTGILVFTPGHPAATLAAAEIVKAILFRKLREVFHVGSPIYRRFQHPELRPEIINNMIDRAEDVYQEGMANLDDFLAAMGERMPDHPLSLMLTDMIESFRVYYVLNRFDGVESSFQTAVAPFLESVHKNISTRPSVSNLGWIIESRRYHQANADGVPFLLQQHNLRFRRDNRPRKPKAPTLDQRLEQLYTLSGLRKEKTPRQSKPAARTVSERGRNALENQLHAMEALFNVKAKENEVQNFEYILSCIRYLLKNRRISDFGDTRILKPGELMHPR